MAGIMFTITSARGRPSLGEASQLLGIEQSALDPAFGVTLIDPRHDLYAVLVDERAAAAVRAEAPTVGGPFSNPAIGPFGPPEPKRS